MRKDAMEAGWAGVALYEACRAAIHLFDPAIPSEFAIPVAAWVATWTALLIFIPTPADCAAAERGELDP